MKTVLILPSNNGRRLNDLCSAIRVGSPCPNWPGGLGIGIYQPRPMLPVRFPQIRWQGFQVVGTTIPQLLRFCAWSMAKNRIVGLSVRRAQAIASVRTAIYTLSLCPHLKINNIVTLNNLYSGVYSTQKVGGGYFGANMNVRGKDSRCM